MVSKYHLSCYYFKCNYDNSYLKFMQPYLFINLHYPLIHKSNKIFIYTILYYVILYVYSYVYYPTIQLVYLNLNYNK